MATKTKAIKISQKHLLGIQDLSINDVNLILKEAEKFIELNKSLRGKLKLTSFLNHQQEHKAHLS